MDPVQRDENWLRTGKIMHDAPLPTAPPPPNQAVCHGWEEFLFLKLSQPPPPPPPPSRLFGPQSADPHVLAKRFRLFPHSFVCADQLAPYTYTVYRQGTYQHQWQRNTGTTRRTEQRTRYTIVSDEMGRVARGGR